MKKINSKIIVTPNESSNILSAVRKPKGRNQSKKQNISVDSEKQNCLGKSGFLILSK